MGWTKVNICLLQMLMWVIVTCSESEENNCDVEMFIDPKSNVNYTISSPGYPNNTYSPGVTLTWCATAPENTTVTILCELDIPKSDECALNALFMSSSQNELRSYCGTKSFRLSSITNEMTITLHSSKKSRGGMFSCRLLAEDPEPYSLRAIIHENCDCGYSYRMRIVGGVETGVNEFPFMAGLVDARRTGRAIIQCGATIISPRYVMTVAHCLDELVLDKTAVVVGEHNIRSGSDTPATNLIRAERFLPYPYYNNKNDQYDIAMVKLVFPLTYSARVGPVCLPFASRSWDLTGEVVTILGWGATEFGGPRSDVLQKANVDIYDISNCISVYGSKVDPYTQWCTFRKNVDACQFDSGGPLLYFNYYTNRYEITGLIAYGIGCASELPSINTKVAPFLQWVIDETPGENFCFKSE